MIKILSENSDFLSNNINIQLRIECAVCGYDLEVLAYNDTVKVLPCKNCIVFGHAKNHDKAICRFEENNAISREKTIKQEKLRRQKLEDEIYAKFEKRFKELMKE